MRGAFNGRVGKLGGGGPTPPPVDPDPANLDFLLWYRADSITTPVGNATAIDTFIDKTGHGYDQVFSAGNVNTRATLVPVGLNGKPSFTAPNPFAGNTTGYDNLSFPINIPEHDGAITMFAVLQPSATVDSNSIYRFFFSTANDTTTQFDGASTFWTPFDTPNQLRMNFFHDGLSDGGGETHGLAGDWSYMAICINWLLGTINVYLNGTLVQTVGVGNSGTVAETSCFFLRGSRGGHAYSQFDSWFGGGADFGIAQYDLHTTGKMPLLNQYVSSYWGALP